MRMAGKRGIGGNPQVRLVIFDLDGTLIDAYKAVYQSINFRLARSLPCPGHCFIRCSADLYKHIFVFGIFGIQI